MPRLLICGFESFPAAPVNPAAAAVRRLQASGWRAGSVDTDYLTIPVAWKASVETIEARLEEHPTDAVLIVGVAVTAQGFRVETQGRNRACATAADALGRFWTDEFLAPHGPLTAPATSPCPAMVEAVAALGLPVEASEDAGDYLCNFTLYRLLHGQAARVVGFLHVPQARECDPAGGFALDEIVGAVQASAGAIAAALTQPALGAAT